MGNLSESGQSEEWNDKRADLTPGVEIDFKDESLKGEQW
jgi:hypothetical protein